MRVSMTEIIKDLALKIGVIDRKSTLYRDIDWSDIDVGDGVEFQKKDYAYTRVMASRMSKRLKRRFITAKRGEKYYVVRLA